MSIFAKPAPAGPPPVEQVFNGAQASAAYAKTVFTDAVDELVGANDALDEVIARTTAEIDRLDDLRTEAEATRVTNAETIRRLRALIG